MATLRTATRPTSAAPLHHLLTLDELGPGGLRSLLDLTGRPKRDPDTFRNRLTGRWIGMIFDKPSMRTRVSLESAAWMLGMLPIVLRPDELQLGRGETIADTAAWRWWWTRITRRWFGPKPSTRTLSSS